MNTPHGSDATRWRTASTTNNTCVELAHHGHGIRDSKNHDQLHGIDTRALLRAVTTDLLTR
ncbi:hypothetical protein UO65_4370 [Actinokineospora spheciospongiae]|uniref:DUF397 domain-containing protein n=1 Tax=Actinokineospora spheciospongiae TaxID=909613 RepID=W7IU39_9PSEU|nr:DUF397 domain-containing protein [Actinokineospora spheciospongiae]EWC60262.1 hypothetical protein UO65_4370 [Actinokineospora spheciospongiae]